MNLPQKKSKPQGLFYGLLGGEAAVIFQDATENPSKYDDRTVELLRQLVQGQKQQSGLVEVEEHLLDQAALTFASYVAPPKKERSMPAPTVKVAEEDTSPPEGMAEMEDIPMNTTAFWWL